MTSMQDLLDRAAILDVLNALFRGVDRRDWPLCRSAFASQVDVDYGTAESLSADVLVDRWRSVLTPLDMTQHLVANHHVVVDGERATVESDFLATHLCKSARGGHFWTLGGRYEHVLARTEAGWLVVQMRMIPKWSTGNAELLAEAREGFE